MRVDLGPSGRRGVDREGGFFDQLGLSAQRVFWGAQQPETGDLVGSNNDAALVPEVEGAAEEEEEAAQQRQQVRC